MDDLTHVLKLAENQRLTLNLMGRLLLRVLSDNWQSVAKDLKVSEVNISNYKKKYPTRLLMQKISVFDVWRKKEGYKNGIKVLLKTFQEHPECVVDWDSIKDLLYEHCKKQESKETGVVTY
ncbi:hypothetical protein Ahia01_000088100 [Argonauta hians]